MNYHLPHHIFPQVPYHALPKLQPLQQRLTKIFPWAGKFYFLAAPGNADCYLTIGQVLCEVPTLVKKASECLRKDEWFAVQKIRFT